jgi:hypothetical protein
MNMILADTLSAISPAFCGLIARSADFGPTAPWVRLAMAALNALNFASEVSRRRNLTALPEHTRRLFCDGCRPFRPVLSATCSPIFEHSLECVLQRDVRS